MRFILLIGFFSSLSLASFSRNEDKFNFPELDRVINEKDRYEKEKINQISHLKDTLKQTDYSSPRRKFMLFEELHHAYFTFDYDSAMAYALQMIEIAKLIPDSNFLAKAKLNMATTLLASGIFSEAMEMYSSIDISGFNDSLKVEYYYDCSRLYFDIVDYYQKSYIIDKYLSKGFSYLDSAIALTKSGSVKYYSLNGLKLIRNSNDSEALRNYETLFQKYHPTGRQLAIDASTYGFVLQRNGRINEGIKWVVQAAIEDIKLANKENVALFNLANKLFQLGYIEKSSKYLNIALEDARSYGALQRKFQISQIQPIVEAARIEIIQEQKSNIKRYATTVTVLSVIIVIILFILFLQLQKVKAAKNMINQSNEKLKQNNQKLREVNLIKEKYIGQFFKTNSDLIEKLDFFRQSIENKVRTRKIDELGYILKKQNIRKEREAMYQTFDSVFLSIFPDFVNKFNELFNAKDQIILKFREQMNTDLRIFALIRLGINDTEKIAHILDYSVNTINTYKTKIKNRSIVSNDDFEGEILKIQSI